MDKHKKKHRFSSIKEAVEYVEKIDECLIFQGSLDTAYGYGYFSVNNVVYRAHRASYEFYKGKIPKEKIICHRCNVKACINPEHLYAGTRKDNAQDRMFVLRERESRGEISIDKGRLRSTKDLINDLEDCSKKFTMYFPRHLYDSLKLMCVLTRKNMATFIRAAVIDKINQLKVGTPDGK